MTDNYDVMMDPGDTLWVKPTDSGEVMPLDWRIQCVMDARNLLREADQAAPAMSDLDKALQAGMLSAEIAWNILEQEVEAKKLADLNDADSHEIATIAAIAKAAS